MAKKKVSKVVLAYSGGLDTSCIVPWLIENYGCEVVTFTADLGQEEELDGLPEKAEHQRCGEVLRGGPAPGVRQRLRLPHDAGRRDLRAPVPAGDVVSRAR